MPKSGQLPVVTEDVKRHSSALPAILGGYFMPLDKLKLVGICLLGLALVAAASIYVTKVGFQSRGVIAHTQSGPKQSAQAPPATAKQTTSRLPKRPSKPVNTTSKSASSGKSHSTASANGSGSTSSGGTGSTGGSGASFVSGAFDLGWQSVGSSAPFSAMNEDFLFALQTENGSGLDTQLLSGVPSITSWVASVHTAPHANDRAMLTIGGSSDQNWENACNSTNQAAFVANLISFMKNNHFDGLDIDMEDDTITAAWPVPTLWTGCAEAIIGAAHATTTNGHRPIVSEDVITNWEGPWLQAYESSLDQINLMTYGDTCTSASSCPTFAADISDTANQLCPSGGGCIASVESRFVLGLDMDDSPGTEPSCGYAAAYAKAKGYLGAFNWDLTSDQHLGSTFPCQAAIATNG